MNQLQEAKTKKKQIKKLFDTINKHGCVEEICGDDITAKHSICTRDIGIFEVLFGYDPRRKDLTKNYKITVQKVQELVDKIIGNSELYLFIHPQNGIMKMYLKEQIHYYYNEAKEKVNWKYVFFSNKRSRNKKIFETNPEELVILTEILRQRKYVIKVKSIKDDPIIIDDKTKNLELND